MKYSWSRKTPLVTYSVYANCVDIEELKGLAGRRKRISILENTMKDLSTSILDDCAVDTFCFANKGNLFHFLIMTDKDRNTIDTVMDYIREAFEKKLNETLKRIGPVWDGQWECEVIE